MTNFNRMYRSDLLITQNRQCAYCFTTLSMKNATLEHVVPRSKGGRDHKSNFKTSCLACNALKADMSESAFKNKIKHPAVNDPFAFWEAHIRRRLSLATNRSCRNIKRFVGMDA